MPEDKTIFDRLIEASKDFRVPKKNSFNPHYKSKYADLQEVIDCIKQPLLDAGLTFTQKIVKTADEVYPITLVTILTDGKKVEVLSEYPVSGGNPQMIGSALTYAKRYSLASAFGLASDEDDDGNNTEEPQPDINNRSHQARQTQQKGKNPNLKRFGELANEYSEINGIELTQIMQTVESDLGYKLASIKDPEQAEAAIDILKAHYAPIYEGSF